ncbi:2'-5' RNA ligase family protein [Streptomyces sp. NPDC056061]|uniref:2'-5' RNA ligase family protein n=1 Tax=Streptomyces sp. NPDC056061 TaxID=3345700 RepID=UPI0035DFBF9B
MTPDPDVHPKSFPQSPPSDLADPGLIVEHDWQAFSTIERMEDHWARPGWSDGHRAYYWMLTFPEAFDLIEQARYCQAKLAHLGMDSVPADGLHVTMVRIGSTDAVPDSKVRLLANMAEQLPQQSFSITAHPLAGSRGAVRFTLTPWTPLVGLHAALSAIGRQADIPGGSPTSAFRPHLGVQYSNQQCPAAPVVESVARLRTLAPVTLDITSVQLVELRRTLGPPAYRWHVVRSIPLRSAPSQSIQEG